MITTTAPRWTATGTRPAAGKTPSVEPTARRRSQDGGGRFGQEQVFRHKALTEADGGGLQDPAADAAAVDLDEARRVGLAASHPLMDRLTRLAVAADEAHDVAGRAVYLDRSCRVGPGFLMQPVDVLRHQCVEATAALELDERAVPRVGLGVPQRRRESVLPGAPAMFGIGQVGLQRHRLLGLGVLRPQAVRSPEILNARIGRNPGAGQDEDGAASLDQATGTCEVRLPRLRCHVVHEGHGGTEDRRTLPRCPVQGPPRSNCCTRPTPRCVNGVPPRRCWTGVAPKATVSPSLSVRRPT